VEIDRQGERTTVQARKGVVLAAGGFGQNQEMREQYLPQPTSAGWSTAYEGNTGDAIRLGLEIGADVDLMDDAWWGSVFVPPDGLPFFTVMERQSPGSIIVNQAGRRFVNEAIAYTDFVHAVYAEHRDGEPAIPFYFIMDQRCRSNYMFGSLMPGQGFPDEYYAAGLVKKADTVAELARQIGVDPGALEETVERFSGYARGGKDQEFRKGETPFEHVYADPARWPNPCLAPIDQPPFYAVTMVPGDLGTKGGLLTDEYARVLGEDGSVIGGLYATGNTAASVMGNAYAGAGGTIGPAMAFGYVAARHLAGTLE
jgi:3-oxosteroid 1-dehydrogenase